MPLRFNWNSNGQFQRMSAASFDALDRASVDAKAWWDATAPVGTDPRTSGDLRNMWFSDIVGSAESVTLYFGSLAPHAVFVELGTGRMAPRAPIRTVAGEITPLLGHYLFESLTDGSGRTR